MGTPCKGKSISMRAWAVFAWRGFCPFRAYLSCPYPPGCRPALPWAMCSLPFQGVRPQRQVFPSLRNLSYFYMFFFLFSFWHDNAYSLTMIFSILVFCISVFVVFPIEDDEASGRGWWCEGRFYLRASSQGKGVLAPSSGDNHHHHNHFTLTLFVLFVLSVVK